MAEPSTDLVPDGGVVGSITRGMPFDIGAASENLRRVDQTEGAAVKDAAQRGAERTRMSQSEIDDAYRKITPVDPAQMQPWNAKEKAAEFSTNPLNAFGSFAMIAAAGASMFTRQPMTNSLNAAAGAINAMADKNDKEYDRAFKAWKENTDLAIKRHQLEQADFDQVLKKVKAGDEASVREFDFLLKKHGFAQMQAMREAGYFSEVYDAMASHFKAQEGYARSAQAMDDLNLKRQMLKLDPDYESGDPARQRLAIERVQNGRLSPEQEMLRQFDLAYPGASYEERLNAFQKIKQYGRSYNPVAEKRLEYIEKARNEIREKHGREPTAEEEKNILAGAFTTERGLTGNQKVAIQGKIDQLQNSLDTIGTPENANSALGILDRHIGAAGIAGRVTRLAERVGNILGSNSTDREQFMRYIELLKLNAPRLLTDSTGRPLAAEASRINDIIGGLSLGDTTANTIRSLEEIQRLYKKMQQDNLSRLQGTWQPPAGLGGPDNALEGGAKPAPSSQPWLNDAVVK